MTAYVGVDPGLNGGIGCLYESRYPWGGAPIESRAVWPMPTVTIETKKKNQRKLDAFSLREIFTRISRRENGDVFVLLETPQMRPAVRHSGHICPVCNKPHLEVNQGIQSQAAFVGQGEKIEGLLIGLGISFESVSPATWKRDVFRGQGGDDKDASRMKALSLFPDLTELKLKKNDGLAEGILLAWYLRARHTGVMTRKAEKAG